MSNGVRTQIPPKNEGRLFTISKQSFSSPNSPTWTQPVKAKDRYGEEIHYWVLKNGFTRKGCMTLYTFDGYSKDKTIRYDQASCQIAISDKNHEFVTAQRLPMTGSNSNRFKFDLLMNNSNSTPELIKVSTLTYTIATKDEFLIKSLSPLKSMLDKNLLTDIVIQTSEGPFPCHKVILAAESRYFRTMFLIDMKEKTTNTVDWTGVFEASVVQDLLHFIYMGLKPPNIIQNHFALLEAANLCLLPKLKSMCLDSIRRNIDVDNATQVFEVAEKYDVMDIKDIAQKFLVKPKPLDKRDTKIPIDDNDQSLLKIFLNVFAKN